MFVLAYGATTFRAPDTVFVLYTAPLVAARSYYGLANQLPTGLVAGLTRTLHDWNRHHFWVIVRCIIGARSPGNMRGT